MTDMNIHLVKVVMRTSEHFLFTLALPSCEHAALDLTRKKSSLISLTTLFISHSSSTLIPNVRWYDEDGSVPGPSSRLLRLMDNGADSLDESGASSDDSERW